MKTTFQCFFAVAVVAVACSGCAGLRAYPLEDVLSALGLLDRADELPFLGVGVAAVEAECERFEQPQDHPLLDVAAGTVLDDLAGLEGCWGACVGPQLLQAQGFLRADVEFYRFDLAPGRMIYQVVQRGEPPFGLFDVSLEHVYSFEVTGPDRITVRLVSVTSSSTLGSEGQMEGPREVPDAEPFDLQITLQGDVFKFGDCAGASADFSGPHRANLVFFRFDCPP
ncbi:MAG TPA: hypothetical protein VM487_22025 [Phycisphaerae bacterium]|nr:hypothetical protein [Phycisphaerae bacterium]